MSTSRTYISVDLSDFDDEAILTEADRIRRRKANAVERTASNLDVGSLVLMFNSWDALKLREAVRDGYAYVVLDLIKLAFARTEEAAQDA